MLKNKIIVRKIRNILILLMAIIIMIGAYKNIENSRAEDVIEINAVALDNYGYLENEDFILEANEISDGLYEIQLPESVNGKKINEIVKITLEDFEDTTTGEGDSTTGDENTETEEGDATTGETTSGLDDALTGGVAPIDETTSNETTGTTTEESTTTEGETSTEEGTTTEGTETVEDNVVEIVDNKIQLTAEQIDTKEINIEVTYDVMLFELGEEEPSKTILSELTEEEKQEVEIKEQTEILYSKVLTYEDEENGKLVEVRGYLPQEVQLKVEEVTQEKLTEIFGEAQINAAYDISLIIEEIQQVPVDEADPESEMEEIVVTSEIYPSYFSETCEVLIQDNNIVADSQVYHVNDDNTYEQIEVKESIEKSISFETDTFSIFAVSADESLAGDDILDDSLGDGSVEDAGGADGTTGTIASTAVNFYPHRIYVQGSSGVAKSVYISAYAYGGINITGWCFWPADQADPTDGAYTGITAATSFGTYNPILNNGVYYHYLFWVRLSNGSYVHGGDIYFSQATTDNTRPTYEISNVGATYKPKLQITITDNVAVRSDTVIRYEWSTTKGYGTDAGTKVTLSDFTNSSGTYTYTIQPPSNTEGTYYCVVRYYIVDTIGNCTYVNTYYGSYSVDTVAPTGGTTWISASYTNKTTVTVYISGGDGGLSGLSLGWGQAWFGGSWVTYNNSNTFTWDSTNSRYYYTWTFSDLQNTSTGATNNGEGTYSFMARLYDGAGNYSYIKTSAGNTRMTCIYDVTAPTGTLTISKTVTNASTVTVYASSVSDNLSGIEKARTYAWFGNWSTYCNSETATWDSTNSRYYYQWTFSNIVNSSTNATNCGEGTYKFQIRLYDNAGNYAYALTSGGATAATCIYDVTAPTGTMSISARNTNATTVTVYATSVSDNLSGVSYATTPAWFGTSWVSYHSLGTMTWDSTNSRYYYQWTFSNIINTSTNATNNGEGRYQFQVRLYDSAGNMRYLTDASGATTMQCIYDVTKPTGTHSMSATVTNASTVTIYISAPDDNLSGVSHGTAIAWQGTWSSYYNSGSMTYDSTNDRYYYTWTFANIKNSSSGATGNGDGYYYFKAHLYDKAGNDLYPSSIKVTYDTTAPSTFSVTHTKATSGTTYDTSGSWTNESINVSATYADALSGINASSFAYKVGSSGTWTSPGNISSATTSSYSATPFYSADRKSTIYYRIKDVAGNEKTAGPYYIWIDKTVPTISVTHNTEDGATYSGGWTNQNIISTITFADSSGSVNSGINASSLAWNADGGSYSTITANTSTSTYTDTWSAERNSTCHYKIADNAGNEATVEFTIKIERTSPTITVSPTSATVCKTTSITITASDTGGSGLASNSYQYYLSTSSSALSGGSWTNYTSGTAFTAGTGLTNTYYLYVKRVSDNAGNVSTANGTATTISSTTYQRFGTYVFDNSAPTITVSPTSGAVAKTRSITITVADVGSAGLATSGNSYQYYLSTSSSALSGGSWTNYTSGTAFTAGSGLTGTYYLYVKRVNDAVGNTSTTNGTATTISSVVYQRFGTYIFDNSAPTITLGTNTNTTWSKTHSVTVTIADVGAAGLAAGSSISVKYGWSTSTSTAPSSYTTATLSNAAGAASTTFTASGSGLTGQYYLWVVPVSSNYVKDTVGNVNSSTVKSTGTFYFDNTAPTGTGTLSAYYTNQSSITVYVTASDGHSGMNYANIVGFFGSSFVSYGNVKQMTWDSTNSRYYYTFNFADLPNTSTNATSNGQGTYGFSAHLYDKAGNLGYTSTVTAIYDTTKPTITLGANSNTTWAKTGSVTVTIGDALSGLATGASIQYGWSLDTTNAPSYTTATISSYSAGASTATFTASASGLSGKYYLWVKPVTLKDRAGNSQTSIVKSTGQFYFDNTAPVITVSPTSTTSSYSNYVKTQSVTIKAEDAHSGLATSGNSYQYYLSSSSTALADGSWTDYTSSGSTVTIGSGLTGEYYLFVKRVNDKLGITSTTNGTATTVSSVVYQRFGPYKFDNTAPTYTSIEIKNVTNTGYDVYVYGVSDAHSGVNRVQFPTWTDNIASGSNAQDDIQSSWTTNSAASGTNQGDGTWYYRVNVSDHNNEEGWYNTHVYFYDNLGNSGGVSAPKTYVDRTAPTISVGSGSTTWSKSHSVTVTLADNYSGIASGASIKYGWSTSTSTAPSSYTTATLSYTAGATNTTFTATGSGYTGKYYLWVVAETYKDVHGNSGATTVKSSGTFYFDNTLPVISPDVVKENLIRNYDADNNNGSGHSSSATTWKDLSGTQNGTLTGGTWSTENQPNDEYLSLDGTDDWVNLGQATSIVTNNAVTLEATVVIDEVQSGEKIIIANFESGGVGLTLNSGKPTFQIYAGGYKNVIADSALTVGQKYHLLGTYDGTTLNLYIDGVLTKTSAQSGTLGAPASSTVLAIGTNPSGTTPSGYAKFKIYSARVYDKALTQAEVTQNKSASIANKTWAKSHNITGMISDAHSGLATGASLQYAWSTSNTTAPSFSTSATVTSYTAGAANTTFAGSGSGLTGKYYLWVKPVTLKDTSVSGGNSNTTNAVSSTRVYFDNTAPTVGTLTMKLGSSSGSNYTNGTWTNQSVYIAVNNGSDAHSGHKTTTFTVKQGSTTLYSNRTAAVTLDPGSGSEATYTITVTTVDNAGNSTTSSTYTVNIDKIVPVWTYSSKDIYYSTANDVGNDSYANADRTVKIIFKGTDSNSHTVTSSLTSDNITVSVNGTAVANSNKSLATSGNGTTEVTHTLTITGITGDGDLTVSIPANSLTDHASNKNVAKALTTDVNIDIDNTSPTIAVAVTSPAAGTYKGGQVLTITATYNENVYKEITSNNLIDTAAEAPTMTLTFGGTAAKNTVSCSSVSGKVITYTYTIKDATTDGGTDGDNGVLKVSVGTVYDAAGNAISASNVTPGITADTIDADLTITADKTSPTNASSITYTFTFNEPVTGFTKDDITLSATNVGGTGTASKGTFTAVSTTVYTLVVNTVDNVEETLTITVGEGVCTDMVGNPNVGPVSSETIVVDRIDPTVTITANRTSPTNAEDITYTFTFSEAVTGFAKEDITINSGKTAGTFTTVSSTVYTLVVPTTDNEVYTESVTVATGKCVDKANNGNVAKTSDGIQVDRVDPTVTVSPEKTTNSAANDYVTSVDVTITVADPAGAGLSTSNSYQYYLSTSSSTPTGGSWTDYTSGTAFTLGTGKTGEFYLFVKKVSDKAGNVSTTSDYHIYGKYKFDNTAPTYLGYDAFYSGDNSAYTSGTWTNDAKGEVHTTISARDDNSGVSYIQYKEDSASSWSTFNFSAGALTQSGTTWSGTEPWGLRDRDDNYYFRIVDKVGNAFETSSTVWNIKYDLTEPIAGSLTMKYGSSSGSAYSTDTWTNQNVYIAVVNGSDTGTFQSGHASTTFSYTLTKPDGTTTTSSGTSATLSDEGVYSITVTTKDVAGNSTTNTTTWIVKIDKTAPTNLTYTTNYSEDSSSSYTSGTWYNGSKGSVRTIISATDTASGISCIQYKHVDSDTWNTFGFGVSALTKSGNTWTGTENWGLHERNDSYDFKAIDVAGNEYEIPGSPDWIIRYDLTNPIWQLENFNVDSANAKVTVDIVGIDKATGFASGYASCELEESDITLYIDGEQVDSTTANQIMALSKTVDTSGVEGRYQLTLSNFGQTALNAKGYQDWSGTISIKIAADTLTDIAENTSDEQTLTAGFADLLNPYLKYTHQTTDIDQTNKKYTMEFTITDKYYASGELTIDDLTIEMQNGQVDANGDLIVYDLKQEDVTIRFTDAVEIKVDDVNVTNASTGAVETIDDHLIGHKYTLVIEHLEQLEIAEGETTLDYSGIITVALAANQVQDRGPTGDGTNPNKNVAKTITSGVNIPGGTGSGTVVDVVQPIWEVVSSSANAVDQTATITVRGTDTYFDGSTLTTSNLKVFINGTETTTGITKTVEETELNETRIINGTSSSVQYGVQYKFTITGFAQTVNQVKIQIPAGTLKDESGNLSEAVDYIIYNCLELTSSEDAATDGFLDGNGTNETGIARQDIEKVIFTSSISGATGAAKSWDVSAQNDGSIKAWTAQTAAPYTVYIGSDYEIFANQNSSCLFSYIGYAEGCTATETIKDLDLLNVSSVTDMLRMFSRCGYTAMTSLDLGDNFDTSRVVNMNSMFSGCGYTAMTTLDLGDKFDTSSVTNMLQMFMECGYTAMTSLDLSSGTTAANTTQFNTGAVQYMMQMFESCGYTAMTTLEFGNNFNTSNVTEMGSMFESCGYTAMTSLDLGATGVTFDTSKVTSMYHMFWQCGYTAMTSLDLGDKFDTSSVTGMTGMFYRCGYTAMTSLDLSSGTTATNTTQFDTSNVTSMGSMFDSCGRNAMTSLNLGNNFNTSKVTEMSFMFSGCGRNAMTSLNLGNNFNTSKVTEMGSMFNGCGYTAMTSLDLGDKFDTSSVTNMRYMFASCGYTAMTSLDLGDKFDTSSVTDMYGMFDSCGYTAMTTLDLGPAFTKIAETNTNMFQRCGISSLVIYAPESIYADINSLKLNQ